MYGPLLPEHLVLTIRAKEIKGILRPLISMVKIEGTEAEFISAENAEKWGIDGIGEISDVVDALQKLVQKVPPQILREEEEP